MVDSVRRSGLGVSVGVDVELGDKAMIAGYLALGGAFAWALFGCWYLFIRNPKKP
jgi:hypothetical protein